MREFRQHWQFLFPAFKLDSLECQSTFLELIELYAAPLRFYHNLTHLKQVLETVERLSFLEQQNLTQSKQKTLKLGAWFHDAIYDPRRSDNEEKSADYAAEKLTRLAISEAEIDRVRNSILSTKTHQAGDLETQILLDADLAILGAPPAQYLRYARAIRQEYAWVSDRDYTAGRIRVLSNFLARSRIYQTPHFFVELEPRARGNIEVEIARLRAE
ncbi:hypothetical protein [Oscillatoria sp. FACHB-1406]|uniref:HD domain-containing protein n=1 Tax=Oscillatoria sp. FACHB-1406 TaxID=2692846 RepID=UPI0016840AB6|nr:hypothetical protein [Oscillatoria sp. FACHB-1406]MBD2580594.1 hypothetical protein [Oscillatoria sp. FACHB-1406]